MALFDRKATLPDDGHWIGGDVVPALGDGRIKVRSHFCHAAQDLYAYKARSAPAADRDPDGQLRLSVSARHGREVMAEACILDAEGLPYTAAQIREMLVDPTYENLAQACLDASMAAYRLDQPKVEAKAAQKKATAKN